MRRVPPPGTRRRRPAAARRAGGTGPGRSPATSALVNGNRFACHARPPSRFTPPRLSLRPLEPDSTKRIPCRLDQVVHLVKELRQLLDLVDDHDRRFGRGVDPALRHDLAQSRRILRQRQVDAAAKEIDDGSRVELRTEQGRLAGAAGTEQKQRLSLGELADVQRSRVHATGAYPALPLQSTPEPLIFVRKSSERSRNCLRSFTGQRRVILTRWSHTRDSARPWRRRSG